MLMVLMLLLVSFRALMAIFIFIFFDSFINCVIYDCFKIAESASKHLQIGFCLTMKTHIYTYLKQKILTLQKQIAVFLLNLRKKWYISNVPCYCASSPTSSTDLSRHHSTRQTFSSFTSECYFLFMSVLQFNRPGPAHLYTWPIINYCKDFFLLLLYVL